MKKKIECSYFTSYLILRLILSYTLILSSVLITHQRHVQVEGRKKKSGKEY